MKKLILVALLTLALVPMAAFAQTSTATGAGIASCSDLKGEGITGIVSCIIGFFNIATYLIMAGSVVYIVWGASKLMREEGREEGKNIVLYGIVGLFVMVSIWGLVNILDNTFNLSGGNALTPPPLVNPR